MQQWLLCEHNDDGWHDVMRFHDLPLQREHAPHCYQSARDPDRVAYCRQHCDMRGKRMLPVALSKIYVTLERTGEGLATRHP